MAWTEYNYLFAISLIGAFIDAYGIGANDVASESAVIALLTKKETEAKTVQKTALPLLSARAA